MTLRVFDTKPLGYCAQEGGYAVRKKRSNQKLLDFPPFFLFSLLNWDGTDIVIKTVKTHGEYTLNALPVSVLRFVLGRFNFFSFVCSFFWDLRYPMSFSVSPE